MIDNQSILVILTCIIGLWLCVCWYATDFPIPTGLRKVESEVKKE